MKLSDFYYGKNNEYFNVELAITELIRDDILDFGNGRKTVDVGVNSSDIFAWGCADMDDIKWAEIEDLTKLVCIYPKWGFVHWLCIKRQMKPQEPVTVKMKAAGEWAEYLDEIPAEDNP